MLNPELLLQEISPNGNLMAFVEQTEHCCHFYLQGEKDSSFGLKSCWVRNFTAAPEQLDVNAMRNGVAPMLPQSFCLHPDGAPRFNSQDLALIWAEEGDAAALTHGGEIIAIIPSWSGMNGFHGYARDCSGESPLCWELGTPETNAQFARYAAAADYWQSWSADPSPWPPLQDSFIRALEKTFGPHSNYYAIDGGQWPPKALLRIPTTAATVLATTGICIRPQPAVELHFEDPAPHRRIEFAMAVHPALTNDLVMKTGSYLSGQSNLPWQNFTFLGHGHTLPCEVLSEFTSGRFPFILFVKEGLNVPHVPLPAYQTDPVNLLWLVPISAAEQQFATTQGSAALIERLEKSGANWIFQPARPSAC